MMRRFGRLGGNVLVGGLARVWRLGLQFVFTPIYIALLGPEAYGLVSVNATLVLLIAFLDGAVSPVVVRELGRMAQDPDAAPRMRRLVRSLEYLSVATAAVIGILVAVAAPWIAQHWLQAGSLSQAEVTNALRLMGFGLALQWPSLLYSAVVLALHRQGDAFRVMLPVTLVQAAGAALVLWLHGPDILAFLSWQACLFGISSAILARVAWRALPPAPDAARFALEEIRRVWRFAAGSFVIYIAASLLTQADKVVMARVLALDAFAGYALAFFVAQNAATLVMAPISSAVHPHLAALVAAGDQKRLYEEYLRWSELTALVGFTLLGTLAVFPAPPLQLWLGTSSPLIAPIADLLPLVLLGTLLNALVAMPFGLMMATGWVRRLGAFNGALALLYCLLLWWLAPLYGILVGPVLWVAVNVSYFAVLLPWLHSFYLRGFGRRWFWQAIAVPGLTAVAVLGVARLALPADLSRWHGIAAAALVSLVLGGSLLLVLPRARQDCFGLLRRFRASGV